jgi:hypothetical protein
MIILRGSTSQKTTLDTHPYSTHLALFRFSSEPEAEEPCFGRIYKERGLEDGRRERPNRVLLHKDSIKWISETLFPPCGGLGIKEDELVTLYKPG